MFSAPREVIAYAPCRRPRVSSRSATVSSVP